MQIKWDLEHVYFYLVSFIALILIIIGAVNITQTAIAYITPVHEEFNPFTPRGPSADLAMWEEEFGPELMEEERDRFETISRENYTRRLIRDLIGGLAFVIIALPVYLYHWRKIPRLESEGDSD
jgi:hypothetical protein